MGGFERKRADEGYCDRIPFLVGTVTAWCVWVHNRDVGDEEYESDDEEEVWERRPLLRARTG